MGVNMIDYSAGIQQLQMVRAGLTARQIVDQLERESSNTGVSTFTILQRAIISAEEGKPLSREKQ